MTKAKSSRLGAAKPAPPPPAPAPVQEQVYNPPPELEIPGDLKGKAKDTRKSEKKTPSGKAKQQDKRVRAFGAPGDASLPLAGGVPADSAALETPAAKGGRQRKLTYQDEIKKMMFTFGDARQTDPAASELVEDTVRNHIVDLAVRAAELVREKGHSSRASQGGTRITVEEILFLIRNDINTLRRVQEYLAWKDVRKRLQKASEKAEAADAGGDEEEEEDVEEVAGELAEGAVGAGDPAADALAGGPETLSGAASAGQPSGSGTPQASTPITRPARIREPMHPRDKQQMKWDLPRVLAAEAGVELHAVTGLADGHGASSATVGAAQHAAGLESERLRRLKLADELTRRMTRDEYEDYTECRQASFSYKKAKRFREWARFVEHNIRVADDLIDVLGFLAWETVGRITEAALRAQRDAASNPARPPPVHAPPAPEPGPAEPAQAQEAAAGAQEALAGEAAAAGDATAAAEAKPASETPAKPEGDAAAAGAGEEGSSSGSKRKREDRVGDGAGAEEEELLLFMPRHDNKNPLREEHVSEALRRLAFTKRARLSNAP
eukprot:tig00000912_g5435.t1